MACPAEPTHEAVWKVLAEYLPLGSEVMDWEADPEEDLDGLHVTDLTRVLVAVALEEVFDILVRESAARKWKTVGDIIRHTQERWRHEHAARQ